MTERDTQEREGQMMHVGDLVSMQYGEEQEYECKDHGAYRGKPFSITGGRTWIPPACETCYNERKAREAVEAEQAQAAAKARQRTASGVPERFRTATLQGFRAETPGQKRALAIIQRYVERFQERRQVGGCLMLVGRTGTGKTHLACAVVTELQAGGYSALYTDIMGLMQRVKRTYDRDANESEAQAMERFIRPDLLVVDEIGVQYGTDTERAIIHHILDRRYLAVRPTVVAGNVDLAGLKTYLGERAVSRLHEAGGMVVACDWDDYRMRRP